MHSKCPVGVNSYYDSILDCSGSNSFLPTCHFPKSSGSGRGLAHREMTASFSFRPSRPCRLFLFQVSPTPPPLPSLPVAHLLQPQWPSFAQTRVFPAPGKGFCGRCSLSLKILALPHLGLDLNITPFGRLALTPDGYCWLSLWNATAR